MGERKDVAAFYVLAFVISWSIWGLPIAIPQLIDWAPLLILVGAFGPLFAALLRVRASGGRGSVRPWLRRRLAVRRRWRWLFLAGFGLPVAIALAHLGAYRIVIGAVELSRDPPWYWALGVAPINIVVLAWFSSAVEEFGWQGYALPRLSARLAPLAACGLHGLLWGTWHLPLYLLADWSGGNQALWLLYGVTLTLTPILYWLTQRAEGSVVPAVLFHAATNHYTGLFLGSTVFAVPLATNFVAIKVVLYLLVAVMVIAVGRVGFHRWITRPREPSKAALAPS